MIRRALKPVKRRIRWVRAARWAFFGLLGGAGACLALMVASFFMPIEHVWVYLFCAVAACPVIGFTAGLLWPVGTDRAAWQADRCGLKERVRTALAFQDRDDAMAKLQRADALSALKALRLKEKMPVRMERWVWVGALCCSLLAALLLIVPNPQHDVLHAREQVREALRAQADTIEKAAETLESERMTDEERQQLRKLVSDMARDLRTSNDTREALERLDQTQQQMEKLEKDMQRRIAEQTQSALASQPGLKSLSQAMQSGSQAEMQSAISDLAEQLQLEEQAHELAEQLAEAAQSMPTDAAQLALSMAASNLLAGNIDSALSELVNAAEGALTPGTDLSPLMALARSGIAMAGSGQNAGQASGNQTGSGHSLASAQGGGGGAGLGTTQLDAGYTEGFSQSSQRAGGGAIEDRVGEYERIYDPTRIGGDGDASLVSGQKGEGESLQVQLGPGVGNYAGQVPYAQVIGEYQRSAAQAMNRIALPPSMQEYVTRYFNALLAGQDF